MCGRQETPLPTMVHITIIRPITQLSFEKSQRPDIGLKPENCLFWPSDVYFTWFLFKNNYISDELSETLPLSKKGMFNLHEDLSMLVKSWTLNFQAPSFWLEFDFITALLTPLFFLWWSKILTRSFTSVGALPLMIK